MVERLWTNFHFHELLLLFLFRAYFRIQGKRRIYSKSSSYFGNINWFDSSTSKIQSLSGNRFKQVIWFANSFMVYCSCLQFLISSRRFWENLLVIETNLEKSLFIFNKIADTPLWNCKIHGNNFEKNKYEGLPIMVGQPKKFDL